MFAAIIHMDRFPYHLKQPLLQLMLQLDESLPVSVAAVSIRERQIAIDPRIAQDLVLLVAQGSKLIASIPDDNGSVHSYSFSCSRMIVR